MAQPLTPITSESATQGTRLIDLTADVLAAVPRRGIGAMLVAVAIALEDVTPSGQVSVEHIENVLARLRSPPKPELAQTDLQLLEALRADTARYDQLRDIEQQTVEVIYGR